jgi:transaldolase
MTNSNPLKQLESLGQSIWVDYIRRQFLENGDLEKLIQNDGISGVTSNPAIFEKAIAHSNDYDAVIEGMGGQTPEAIYNALSIQDIQKAADQFQQLYISTKSLDGYVSLEVAPSFARNKEGTLAEARRLWREVERPNVMIKVPGTSECVEAIRDLIRDGININVTLLFSLENYEAVAKAYIEGLEARLDQGQNLQNVASVASFFLSRIDTLIDPKLEEKAKDSNPEIAKAAQAALGEVAIASAKKAYQIYRQLFETERFEKLVSHGAQPQRLLWASTSSKNPNYSDVKYIETLIGPHTVNTVPMETLDAYRDHGKPALTVETKLDKADAVLASLPKLGLNLTDLTKQLENEGIDKFTEPFTKLMEAITEKAKAKGVAVAASKK